MRIEHHPSSLPDGFQQGCQVRLGLARLDQARLGQVRLDSVRLGLARLGYTWLGQVRLGLVRSGQVRLGQAWLDQVRLGSVISGQVRLGQVRSGLAMLGQARLVQVGLGQDGFSRVIVTDSESRGQPVCQEERKICKEENMNDNCKCDVYKCVLCAVYYIVMFTCTLVRSHPEGRRRQVET